MERDVEQPEEAIDLGAASEQTLGAEGKVTDLVGMIEHWAFGNDCPPGGRRPHGPRPRLAGKQFTGG
jgi:hypothetical protein